MATAINNVSVITAMFPNVASFIKACTVAPTPISVEQFFESSKLTQSVFVKMGEQNVALTKEDMQALADSYKDDPDQANIVTLIDKLYSGKEVSKAEPKTAGAKTSTQPPLMKREPN